MTLRYMPTSSVLGISIRALRTQKDVFDQKASISLVKTTLPFVNLRRNRVNHFGDLGTDAKATALSMFLNKRLTVGDVIQKVLSATT